jgi:hypothetical protein
VDPAESWFTFKTKLDLFCGGQQRHENIDAFDSQTLDVVGQPFSTPGAQDNRQSPGNTNWNRENDQLSSAESCRLSRIEVDRQARQRVNTHLCGGLRLSCSPADADRTMQPPRVAECSDDRPTRRHPRPSKG